MICQATERAILLWLLRAGSSTSIGSNMDPVTATDLLLFANTGELVKPAQLRFSLYAYVGEEEVKKSMPSLTVVCASTNADNDAPGNHTVDVEIELRMNSVSRFEVADDAEYDVIELIESAGRWLEEMLTQDRSKMRDDINNGHEWCTVQMFPQSPNLQRFFDKRVRGIRATFQVYASLNNYR